MSVFADSAFPKNGTAQEKAEYQKFTDNIIDETTKSYNKDGPRVPNWSLDMQITIDRIKCISKLSMPHGHQFTEDNFDALEAEKILLRFRQSESDISNKGGEYRKRFWSINDPSILVSPDSVFKPLVDEDLKSISDSNPRQLFSEVVASQAIIDSWEKKGTDVDSVLGIKPLREDEVIMVFYHGGGFYLECPGTNRTAALEISIETGNRVFCKMISSIFFI
ncbi:hypothetical protein AYI68_g8011 [Smittium mucronatum]|uniref:Uncharacterized protein n=1 Tax=Smittium mucronatum TaxID=133383 RepID=A0A1R0GM36_9FUNG|nr:hypothetical protein AYI68_g8011 [Smittium mucronatum]